MAAAAKDAQNLTPATRNSNHINEKAQHQRLYPPYQPVKSLCELPEFHQAQEETWVGPFSLRQGFQVNNIDIIRKICYR